AMRRLHAHRMVVLTVLLAMLSPAAIIGFPVGIWALWRLSRGTVKEAFRIQRLEEWKRETGAAEGAIPPAPSRLWSLLHIIALPLCIMGAVGVVDAWLHVSIGDEDAILVLNGYRIWQGAVALAGFLFLGIYYANTFGRERMDYRLSAVAALASLLIAV